MISEEKLAANRANAQHSTGPVTDAGKAISSRNAVSHGLTAKNESAAKPAASRFVDLPQREHRRAVSVL